MRALQIIAKHLPELFPHAQGTECGSIEIIENAPDFQLVVVFSEDPSETFQFFLFITICQPMRSAMGFKQLFVYFVKSMRRCEPKKLIFFYFAKSMRRCEPKK